jgi:hypothetical protein
MKKTVTLLSALIVALSACGSERNDQKTAASSDVSIEGIMDVRASSSVELGTSCANETKRELRIESDNGTLLAQPALEAGKWSKDPDVQGAVVCGLHFAVALPQRPHYIFRVGSSPPLSFSFDDVTRREVRFLDPSQFFDPNSYSGRP